MTHRKAKMDDCSANQGWKISLKNLVFEITKNLKKVEILGSLGLFVFAVQYTDDMP